MREKQPQLPPAAVEAQAKAEWESACQTWLVSTMQLARKLRPSITWGFYNMPGATAENRSGSSPTMNWLWQSVDALFPSIYLSHPDLASNLIAMTAQISEAKRVSVLSSPPKPVFAYTMAEFDDDRWNHTAPEMTFLDPSSFQLEFNHSASAFELDGLILYGGSADGESSERCTEVRQYMTSTFLPAIEAIVRERNAAVTHLKTDDTVPPCADITLFGAIPDDEKDDTAAIQRALDSCVHMGGAVCVPAGVYTVKLPLHPNVTDTCLVIPSHCTLRGKGAAVSTLQFDPEINVQGWWRMLGAATMGAGDAGGGKDKDNTGSASNISIHDLGFHGNTNHTAYPCFIPGKPQPGHPKPPAPLAVCEHNTLMFFYTNPPGTIKGVTVQRVIVQAIAGDAMVFANGVQDLLVEDIQLRDYIRQGVGLGGNALARNHTLRRVTEINPWLVVRHPGGSTVHVEAATGLRDVLIEGCVMNHSLAASTVSNLTIRGNTIHGNIEANLNTQLRVENNTIIATRGIVASGRPMTMFLAATGATIQDSTLLSADFENSTGLYLWGEDEGFNASSDVTIAANRFVGAFNTRGRAVELYGVRGVKIQQNIFEGTVSSNDANNTCECCIAPPSKKAALCVGVTFNKKLENLIHTSTGNYDYDSDISSGLKTDDIAQMQHVRTENQRLAHRLAVTEARLAAAVDALKAQQQQSSPPPEETTARKNITIQELNPPRSSPFRKYLFLNDSSILDSAPAYAQLNFNAPERLGAVIKSDRPWENAYIYSGSNVLEITGVIHLYYQCQAFVPDPATGPNCSTCPTCAPVKPPCPKLLLGMLCLATSIDGVTFIKPSLGTATFNGSKANNIVFPTASNALGFPTWGDEGEISGVFYDPRPGTPPSERYKAIWMDASTQDPGTTWTSADGINFSEAPGPGFHLGGANVWNSGGMIWDVDAVSACGKQGGGNSTGRWLSYGRSDDPANSNPPQYPKVCGDLGAMRGVTLLQSVDLKSLECQWEKPGFQGSLVRAPWDSTDPNPIGNGGPLEWFSTQDADCGATKPGVGSQRITYSVDGRSPWNDVYSLLPFKYGAYTLFFVPIFRHWQYGAITGSNPTGAQVGPPFNTGGDGIVEPRLMMSEGGINVSYTSAVNARDPWIALGINNCPTAQSGSFSEPRQGWCDPNSYEELMGTAADTSLIWPGQGVVLSPDASSLLSYAVTSPFTHNSWGPARKMGAGRRNQVEGVRQRLDGWVSLDAEFRFDNDTNKMPHFTTKAVQVPTLASCPRPQEVQLRLNVQTNVVGFVAVELLPSGGGSSLVGFGRNESDIIVGNFLARPATWRGGNASVNALAGRAVQLHVMFAAARVFSFQFVCVPPPRS